MTCVLDASVAIKGALSDETEPLASAARAIRAPLSERWGLAAPSLLAWEVTNVVHGKAPDAFGTSPADRARAADLILRDIQLREPTPDGLARTGRIAEAETLTVYDAAYLELAARDDGVLITEDQALLEAGCTRLSPDRCLDTAGAFHRIQDGVL